MSARILSYLHTIKYYGILTTAQFKKSNLSQRAAQLTLSSLLAAVPIITIILGVLSFTPALENMQDKLLHFMELHLAPGSSAEILPYLVEFSGKAQKLPIAGIIILFITALLLLNSFESSVQSIWEIKKPRKIRERLLTYWAILTLGPIILIAFLSLYGILISLEVTPTDNYNFISRTLDFGSILLYFLMLFTLNFLTPNEEVSIKLAALSALVGSIGLYFLNMAFSSFAHFFTNYQVIYGAFAAIPIFLIWLQSTWLIVLASICLCAALHKDKPLASN